MNKVDGDLIRGVTRKIVAGISLLALMAVVVTTTTRVGVAEEDDCTVCVSCDAEKYGVCHGLLYGARPLLHYNQWSYCL